MLNTQQDKAGYRADKNSMVGKLGEPPSGTFGNGEAPLIR